VRACATATLKVIPGGFHVGSFHSLPPSSWSPRGGVSHALSQTGGMALDRSVLSSALATYVHRVLTCRGDTPALDL
jgi:hypothetical protein